MAKTDRNPNVSYWIDSTPRTTYPRLEGDQEYDVVIIGAGLVGLTAAYFLKKAGQRVAVLELKEIARGVTGYTTAKISANHELSYTKLTKKHGEEVARQYGESNRGAIEQIAGIIEELAIDCDFRRQDSYTFSESPGKVAHIRREVELTQRLGLPTSFVTETPLPFPVAGAIKHENEAEFHPRKYLLALAAYVHGGGSAIYEHTRAVDVDEAGPLAVKTSHGTVRAADVIVATNFPFLDRGLFFTKVHPHREYVIGAYLNGPAPAGMYMSAGSSPYTVRAQPTAKGELLIVLGGKHVPGRADERERYANVEEWARQRFDVKTMPYRWSTQDTWSVDGLPYAGPLTPNSRVQVVTGLKGWGMTLGTLGAEITAERILGRTHPYARLYSTNRLNPRASAQKAVLENAKVGLRFVADHLKRGEKLPVSQVKNGDGHVLNLDGERVAVYRDADGTLHGVSPVCTHLYCTVKFNAAEKTWDCPCHGSRFDYAGTVIQGPATKDLSPKSIHE